MKVKAFEKTDYALISTWWLQHGWSPVSFEMLPKIGFIVNDICAGFLYINDSRLCHLEWVVSDPDSGKQERSESLAILLNVLENTAKEFGCSAVFTATKHENLIKRYKNNGYITTDVEMTHLIKRI